MIEPKKEINEIGDMETFLVSPAKKRLSFVIEHLANTVVGVDVPPSDYVPRNAVARSVRERLLKMSQLIDEVPPVQIAQRFGNPSYRDWIAQAQDVLESDNVELNHYITNAFGSSQRIDYGTGHELSFIAYWDGLLRTSPEEERKVGAEDILSVFSTYFDLCRKMITTYKLEPAGSHGVWGLDDHFHMPYILGAGQLSALSPDESPRPKDILDQRIVSQEKDRNLYFGAIAFIYSVKRGMFFEHSPILYDVSSIKNWSKVKSGMIKMYNGEVLSKFPVVQHFYFGELFPFK